jgi:predicted nucleotide-binding protein
MALPELRSFSFNLTPQEMRRGIKRIERVTAEVKAFDPHPATPHDAEVSAQKLHISVDAALVQTFGHGTVEYKRYVGASTFGWSVYLDRPTPFSEIQGGLIRCRSRSLAVLEEALTFLKGELEATSEDSDPRASHLLRDKVFVVHGHDEAALQATARFVEQLGLRAIILREQPDQGRTIIEKFQDCAAEVGFAIILLTPDDLAGPAGGQASGAQARQNVIFELGYFAGKLGRGRTCLLRKGPVDIPSDLYGVIYTEMDAAEGWKRKLARELKAARFDFDATNVLA